ncbi:Cob(I)alamin adenosyltransferase @ Cob(I)alamin adenosyltransferase, clustered with cobalamin synthesis [hydrothermal vent metagenome]|uniref:Cob(I)alamin adenosyltransferase @ Cob(I)alamin adenosyltransferase, clustered with cobalamin synthesis n=1 Tax=hydrothermal vent metagenome TaxID=652676 RepID=A0A3B0ZRH5_9ZZZZ
MNTQVKNSNKMHLDEQHKKRMQRKKQVKDQQIATAQIDQGVLLVLTGNGKGKSSSGFGMVARALGQELNIAVVQYIKGKFSTGEEKFYRRFPNELQYYVMGEGFTWETQDKQVDIAAAQKAWQKSCQFLTDESINLVLLDELNIALKHRYIDIDDVVEKLQQRPTMQHVIITGRAAPEKLINIADTVTEMNVIKHAYKNGIKAQKGIEF